MVYHQLGLIPKNKTYSTPHKTSSCIPIFLSCTISSAGLSIKPLLFCHANYPSTVFPPFFYCYIHSHILFTNPFFVLFFLTWPHHLNIFLPFLKLHNSLIHSFLIFVNLSHLKHCSQIMYLYCPYSFLSSSTLPHYTNKYF